MDIPVFLFTGFLDGGKTTFIQSLLMDKEFNKGQTILVLQCEEGEEELDLSKLHGNTRVFTESIDEEDALSEELLLRLQKKYKPTRIMVEYNGMWMLDSLFEALPENWAIAGETLFLDSTTFLSYNTNMRQLVFNKLRTAELVLFNRVTEQTDKMALHKIVRAVSRQCDIAYSYEDGRTEYDEIIDPLPFDINAPVIVVEDKDYALFYQDLIEDFKKYHGKTVEMNLLVATRGRMPKDTFVAGRQMIMCCANDVQFAAFAFRYDKVGELKHAQWYRIRATIEVRFSAVYGKKGPVFKVDSITPTQEPQEPVATFY